MVNQDKSKYSCHFDFNVKKDKASCKHCGVFISTKGNSTSGLLYHVKHTHKITIIDQNEDAEPVAKKSKSGDITSYLYCPFFALIFRDKTNENKPSFGRTKNERPPALVIMNSTMK